MATTHPEDSVESDALQVLNDLKDGVITIGDIMGPLYVSGKDMNPAIVIPEGDTNPAFVAAAVPMGPASDPHVASTIKEVGPPRSHRPNPSPKPEGYDLVVIGAGVAGLLSVICAKALGKRAALIERHYMGGDCLNVGCFPSKAIIRCARAVHEVKTRQVIRPARACSLV
jgi:hypothetical protein